MKFPLICLLALVSPALSVSSAHAAPDEDRVSAVIVMHDADIASLKQSGYMKMAIPPAMINRVDSVTLKRPVRFKDESAVLYNDVDRRSAMVSVRVDDSTIDQIDYQPVELKIYESGFSSIVVEYKPGNSKSSTKVSKKDSGVFITNLANSKSLTGRLAGMKKLMIKSELGKINVVLDEVSQITFEDEDRATVHMENGDKVSGEINFRNITIKSRWGLEDLKVSDIVSISKSFTNSTAMPIHAPGIPSQQPMMAMPGNSPLQSYSHPNQQHMNGVPTPLDPSIGYGFDPYTGQMIFDHAVDQLMQPTEVMPMDQPLGPFFGEPLPVGTPMPMGEAMPMGETMPIGKPMSMGEQPVGGYEEMIQHPMESPSGQSATPKAENDFWFFPQN